LINSPLECFLSDIGSTNATQYIDRDAITRIIDAKAFHVDAGLAISRDAFIKAFGINTFPFAEVNQINFVKYGYSKCSSISKPDAEEQLKAQVRAKKMEMHSSELVTGESPFEMIMPSNIEMRQLQFSEKRDLR